MIEPTDLQAVPDAVPALDFEEFFRAEHDRLFQAVYLLTGDRHEADDVVQEALLRAFERWDRVATMESPAGYLYRTVMNIHRSRLRRMAVRARRVFSVPPAEDLGSAVASARDVHSALAALPPGQREAIVLVEWLDLQSEEAARILGIDAASVRGRVHRARKTLRRALGDHDE